MPLVGELITKIDVDNNGFNKKLNDAENQISKFGKTATMVGAGLAIAIGGVAVAGFVKLLNIINETEERISHLVDTASKFDSSVGGLQKLEYIAKLSGGSLADVESGLSKIVMSLKRLDEGTSSTTAAFEKLGLSQEKLKGMKIDDVYLLVAERLKGITDSTDRAKVASEIFGRSWSSQINIVNSDIKGLSSEFDSFGGTLTGAQAEAVDKYGDSITKLSALFDTFKIQLTALVAPALEMIVNWIMTTTKEMGGLGPVANTVAQYFVSALQIMVSGAQKVIDAIQAINNGFKSAQLSLLEFTQSFSELNFQFTGGNLNMDRMLEIAKLQKELRENNAGPKATDSLQAGLQKIQGSLQSNSTQKIDVKISTERGLRAEIAGSTEMTNKIRASVESIASQAALATGGF